MIAECISIERCRMSSFYEDAITMKKRPVLPKMAVSSHEFISRLDFGSLN